MSLCQKLVLTFVPRYSYGSMLRYVTMSKREKRTQSDCTSQETNSTVKKAKQQVDLLNNVDESDRYFVNSLFVKTVPKNPNTVII